jgi:hypothetical protein
MNRLIRMGLFVAVSPLIAVPFAYADAKNQGYLTDRNGNAVTVRSSGCVKSRDWTPSRANKQCEKTMTTTSSTTRSTK